MSDLNINDGYIAINIRDSKTAHSTRTVYLYDNAVHLINYIDSHPLKKSPDAGIFMVRKTNHYVPMGYGGLKNIIEKIAIQVNPDKRWDYKCLSKTILYPANRLVSKL